MTASGIPSHNEPQVAAGDHCITCNAMGKFDEAIADCNAVLAKFPTSIDTLTSRGNAYFGKGDLDAALNDYNQALKINPNYIRAHAYRGQLFEKRRDTVAARYDYRSASAALTKFDEIDIAIARRASRSTKHAQQPFTYGSPPGREDFYFVAEK